MADGWDEDDLLIDDDDADCEEGAGWGDDGLDDAALSLNDDDDDDAGIGGAGARVAAAVVEAQDPQPAVATSAAAAAAAAAEGWEDSDNLDFSESLHETNEAPKTAVAASVQAAAKREGGWDEDDGGLLEGLGVASEGWGGDDLEFSETGGGEQESLPYEAEPAVVPQPAAAAAVAQDGWNEDEDDLVFSESNDNQTGGIPVPFAATQTATAASPAQDGWNDDDGLDLSETQNEKEPVAAAPTLAPKNDRSGDGEGWNDDLEDEFFDTDEDLQPPSVPPPPPAINDSIRPRPNAAQQQLYNELSHYIASLPSHARSITAVLEAEYNTIDKAVELQQYYAERPALEEYTINKELPRMDYTLTDHTGTDVITEKNRIAEHFAALPSLCVRCANQSLLADFLQVLTGPDRVVRPQYLASAIAAQCKFRVDLQHALTEVVAALDLSLPTERGRWKIAEIRVMIIFKCPVPGDSQLPYVEYRLADLRTTARPHDADWSERLEQCASLLHMMAETEQESFAMQQQPQQPGLNFRDAFLQSGLQASASDAVDGLKSAWQDLDAATGLGSKFRSLPSFLPDASVLEAAAIAQEEEHRAQQQQNLHQQQQRPTSILGGFVRSLAHSVALPDENPDLYQDGKDNSQAKQVSSSVSALPKLYNVETPPTQRKTPVRAEPQLYVPSNEHKETPGPSVNAIPRLYNKETPPQPPPVAPLVNEAAVPRLYNKETPQRPPVNEAEITRLYNTETPRPPVKESAIPRLYNKETPPSAPKPKSHTALPQLYVHDNDDNAEVQDGWDDDVDVDDSEIDFEADSGDPGVSPGAVQCNDGSDTVDLKKWVYDPTTDIIPTRKRWVNPRPGRRTLHGSFAS